MKSLATLLIVLLNFVSVFAQSSAQPLEVLLIGVAHRYNPKYAEDFDYALNKARAFKPDAVFGEWLSAADFDKLTTNGKQQQTGKAFEQIKAIGHPLPQKPRLFIDKTYRLLHDQPNLHQDRMKLAHALMLTHDFGNAYNQLYRLNQVKASFGPEEIQTFARVLGPLDSLPKLVHRPTGEYQNIFFPLCQSLKLDRILPMDCQQYDSLYADANRKAAAAYQMFEEKLDTTSADYTRLMAMYKRLAELQKIRNESTRSSHTLRFTNSAEYDELAYMDDGFGGSSVYDITGFPKAQVLAKEKYWLLRNECMTRNIVDRARATGARRVVVGVGASHRAIMEKLLRAMPGVTVYTLNEYQP